MSQRRGAEFEVPFDGRTLTVAVTGPDDGRPVFLLHGTPGSRTGPKPRSSTLNRLGVKLICYDRPGYGGSTRKAKRAVVDAADDVEAIADFLNVTTFSIVGRSGGGPHALACASRLPLRVRRTAVLVSVAPSNAPGLDWFDDMANANISDYTVADNDEEILAERLRLRATRTASDPSSLIDLLTEQMTPADKAVISDPAIRRLLADSYREALKHGPYGWIDDVLALRSPWRFELDSIKSPVRLWHGVEDNFSPANHARWLANRIPNADLQLQASTAHFGAMEVLPSMLTWLAAWRDEPDHALAGRVRTGAGR